jgi:hypothetical protein
MKWIGKEVSMYIKTFTDCACEFIILKSPMKTSDLIRLIASEPRHENIKKLQWCNPILMTTNKQAMQQFYGFIIPFLCHIFILIHILCKKLFKWISMSQREWWILFHHSFFFYWDMSKNKGPICCLFCVPLYIVYWMSLWHL